MFAAGEEISWGQRIFDFETPDFLMHLNVQNEFNVHNIYSEPFLFVYRDGSLILCMITCVAFFLGKDALAGIPLPSIPLVLMFMVTLAHRMNIGDGYENIYTMEKELLLILVIYALFSKAIQLGISTAATLTLILALSYIYQGNSYTAELREYLFGFCCLFYSLELFLAQDPASRKLPIAAKYRLSDRLLASLCGVKRRLERFFLPDLIRLGRFRISLRLMVWSVVIAGSLWLTALKYLQIETGPRAGASDEVFRLIRHAEPIIRSHFDVYLSENRLIYIKEECSPEDTSMRFFLHVDPVDLTDLPYLRKQYGFDNLDFRFRREGGFFDGKRCVVIRQLPDYVIASIRTGQYIVKGNRLETTAPPIWEGMYTFSLDFEERTVFQ